MSGALDLPWLEPTTHQLDRSIESGRFGHAPLISGPPGTGKRALADWLALRLLCLDPKDGHACGQCKSCALSDSGTHPDFFRLDILEDKTVILVEQVRTLIDRLNLTPSIGTRRVGLIPSADHMNLNAANALLKTLEEPSDEIWLILVSDKAEQLPATICSRCQRVTLPVPTEQDATDWLKQRTGTNDVEDLTMALRLAEGSPSKALIWLEQGQIELANSIRDHLDAMLRDGTSQARVVDTWLDHPHRSWHWLARWSQAWLQKTLTGHADGLEQAATLVSGPESLQLLQDCWLRALEGGRLAEKPIRQEWMMQSWALAWQRLANRVERG